MPPCSELYQPKRKVVLIKQPKCTKYLGGWVRLTSLLDDFHTPADGVPQIAMIIRLILVVADKEVKSSTLDGAAGSMLSTTGRPGGPHSSAS